MFQILKNLGELEKDPKWNRLSEPNPTVDSIWTLSMWSKSVKLLADLCCSYCLERALSYSGKFGKSMNTIPESVIMYFTLILLEMLWVSLSLFICNYFPAFQLL